MKCGTRLAALAIGTVAGLSLTSGCDDGPAMTARPPTDGSRRGELDRSTSADNFETGASQFTYSLRDATGAELPLHFDTRPGLEAGHEIKVWGVPAG